MNIWQAFSHDWGAKFINDNCKELMADLKKDDIDRRIFSHDELFNNTSDDTTDDNDNITDDSDDLNDDSNDDSSDDTEKKINWIKKQCDYHNIEYIDILSIDSIDRIYNYYCTKVEPNNGIESYYFGCFENDGSKKIKYLSVAIDNGYNYAIYILGIYYYKKDDYDNAIKYLTMAIDKNIYDAYYELGMVYYYLKDFDTMEKYHLLGVDHGDHNTMHQLGGYHKVIKKDYNTAIKYYTMAINNGSIYSYYWLGNLYATLGDYDNMMKNYIMGLKNNCLDSFNIILELVQRKRLHAKYYVQLIEELNYKEYYGIFQNTAIQKNIALLLYKTYWEKINIIETPFKYAPNNIGYFEAESNFIQRIKKN